MTVEQSIHGYTLYGSDLEELKAIIKEVFQQHCYYFESEKKDPLIFDFGAHVGVATHYFKHIYPEAQVVAFEPHPRSFKLLQKNVEWNRLEDVLRIQAALIPSHSTAKNLTLYTDNEGTWLSSSSIQDRAWNGGQDDMKAITVPTITLANALANAGQKVDVVKMDIEGAEWDVLMSAKAELKEIKRLILEYHPRRTRHLPDLVDHLEKFGLFLTEPLSQSPKKNRELQILEFVQLSPHTKS